MSLMTYDVQEQVKDKPEAKDVIKYGKDDLFLLYDDELLRGNLFFPLKSPSPVSPMPVWSDDEEE
jgi:hypothetical protein